MKAYTLDFVISVRDMTFSDWFWFVVWLHTVALAVVIVQNGGGHSFPSGFISQIPILWAILWLCDEFEWWR